jgi:hypothetical protein
MAKNSTSWKPGKSPNPGGRPKADVQVKELAREHTAEAIATLVDVMGDKDAPPSARVAAADVMLCRGWGRPAQAVDVTSNGEGLQLGVVVLPPEDPNG